MINQAKQDLLNEKIIREIVGHTDGRSDAHSNYASAYNRETKAAELMKMTGFEKVDFSVIMRWP